MRLMLHVRYPGHVIKQATEVYTSPQMPKRPDYMKELGSIAYHDATGLNVLSLFDVPDDKVGECLQRQAHRSAFFTSRISGGTVEVQVGLSVPEAIKETMPLLP